MNKNYTSIIVLMTTLFFGALSAQETQKNFINYQGVARNSTNELMTSELITITIGLKFGSAIALAEYEENHSVTTDANGVFSLLIGNGSAFTGNYNALSWGSGATFVTVAMNGSEVGTTEMMAVPYAISSGDADNQSAAEVEYDNSISGLAAVTTQDAIDELIMGGNVDADPDPTNELQTISFDSATSELSLSDGNTIVIPTDGTDADADPSNEFQTLSFDLGTNELSLSDGNSVTIPSGGTDADADPTNEIQTISFDAASNKISLTDGGEITIPSGGTDADADSTNEFQTLSFDAGTNELSLSDGNAVIIPSGGTDADADPTNEIQTLAFDAGTNELSLSEGNTIVIPTGGVDGDGDSTNEIQTISFDVATNELSLSDGGSVTIPSGGTDADSDPENEIDVTRRRGLLVGDDGVIDGLVGTADGQVAKWDAALGNWVAGIDETDGPGGSSLWTENGDDLYFNRGKVGIGLTNPTSMHHVHSLEARSATQYTTDLSRDGINDGLSVGIVNTLDGVDGEINNKESGALRLLTNNTMRMNITKDGDVGIGISSPAAKLDVDGDIRSADLAGLGQRNVMADADGNLMIGAAVSGNSPWLENSGDIYYNEGNVGVGVQEPQERIHVGGNLLVQSNLGALQIGFPDNGSRWNLSTANSGANLIFRSKPDGDNNFTTKFKMHQAGEFQFGNIGGTPTAWTHILSNSTISKPQLKLEEEGDDYARLELTNDAASGAFWHVAGLPSATSNSARLNFYFRNGAGGANRMTVTGDGKTGINGTPTARLHIHQKSQSVGTGLRFSDNTANEDWDITHGFSLRFHYGGDLRGFINANTGAYTQASDVRLKKNISKLDAVMGRLLKLKPSKYTYKTSTEKTSTIGLIAQEVQKWFPELVSSSGEDKMLGVDYNAFSVVAIKAIQEQQEIINKQSNMISSLEERVERLEAKMN